MVDGNDCRLTKCAVGISESAIACDRSITGIMYCGESRCYVYHLAVMERDPWESVTGRGVLGSNTGSAYCTRGLTWHEAVVCAKSVSAVQGAQHCQTSPLKSFQAIPGRALSVQSSMMRPLDAPLHAGFRYPWVDPQQIRRSSPESDHERGKSEPYLALRLCEAQSSRVLSRTLNW